MRIPAKDGNVKLPKLGAAILLAAFFLSWLPATTPAQEDATIRIAMYRATMQRDAEHLVVREAYTFENPTGESLTPPGGSLLLDLPHDIHGEVGVTVISGEQRFEGVLIPDATDPALNRLELEMAAGRTTVTLSYNFHYAAETPFQPRFFYPVEQLQLFVQPADMHIHGNGATREAQSPMQGFANWSLEPMSGPGQLELVLSGGSAQASTPTTQPPARQTQRAEEEWRVSVRPNRFAEGQTSMLVGLFLAAVLGLGLLYGINSGQGTTLESAARLKVANDLTRLEDRFVSGQIGRDEFMAQRERILKAAGGGREKGARKRQPVG